MLRLRTGFVMEDWVAMFFKTLPRHHKSQVWIDILRCRSQRTGRAVGIFGPDEGFLFFCHVTQLGPVTALIRIQIKCGRISSLGLKPVSNIPGSVTALNMLKKTCVTKSRPLRRLKQILTACS